MDCCICTVGVEEKGGIDGALNYPDGAASPVPFRPGGPIRLDVIRGLIGEISPGEGVDGEHEFKLPFCRPIVVVATIVFRGKKAARTA